ncbi:Uncharacterised protein [Chryseobacterium taklimakanense]|uniref:NERD domain-containing protein n=1 Tax=Chryseobacterium taklimakanense TaxID=536441 RepID=A0A239XTA2_9FLAO|nr:NERD domain-containing protein [Chryseobacterium taklimakanense]SNV50015.1 Uncharacterised protein [Chryseobacterium taklimakanense]
MEEHEKIYDEWKKDLPVKLQENFEIICDISGKINSLDLISYLAFYNALHNGNEYSDYREDKHFFVAEAVAIHCLKKPIIEQTIISEDELPFAFEKIQEAALRFCFLSDAISMSEKPMDKSLLSEINLTLQRESANIRNPGHPEHHLSFSKILYKPFNDKIEKIFGFSHDTTIIIRKKIVEFLRKKYATASDETIEKGKVLAKQLIKYKKGVVGAESIGSNIVNLEEVINKREIDIRDLCIKHSLTQLYKNFSKCYVFTVDELAEFCDIDVTEVKNFLNTYSCQFLEIPENEKIYQPLNYLHHKPIIKHNESYLIPSIPLFNWAVEEVYKKEFRKHTKLFDRYTKIKHDFLLDTGVDYFSSLLPESKIYKNVFYYDGENRYETDAIIVFDNYVFVIEAKANVISEKAKSGHKDKTKDHLNDLIKKSYDQAVRTIDFIEIGADFYDKNGKLIVIEKPRNAVFQLVSLTLEPLGNIIPKIKTDDELNFFSEKYFPWIISLYDLISINDFFETPSLLFHYLDSRSRFLEYNDAHIYEEMDLVGYFISRGGLDLDRFIEKAKNEGANYVYFDNETDFINNYYMHLFEGRPIKKPSYFKNLKFKELISKIDNSSIPCKSLVSLKLLSFNRNSINDLMQKIEKIKKMYYKDDELHDASIFTMSDGGFGFTFMIGNDYELLEKRLDQYISFKKNQMFAKTWVGIAEYKNEIRIIKILS